jgi:4-hydroxybenzoate polyprenyl transferase
VLWLSGVFGVGAFSQRAAGCIVNDIFDKDIDMQVERTKTRPLASGQLSTNEALLSLGLHLSVGLGVLSQLSMSSVLMSFAIVPVAFLYPLAKRYFKYPQLVLGINFNWGILVGALQTGGIISLPVMLCYMSGVVHTLIYDTVYAHQDAAQDKELNLYSTAYTLPENLPRTLVIPLAGLLGGLCITSGMPLYTYVNLATILTFLGVDLAKTDFKCRTQCGQFFNHYQFYYLAIAGVFVLGQFGKSQD